MTQIHHHSKAEQFNKRKQLNPVEVKIGATETGKMPGFQKPKWSDRVSMELKLDYERGLFQEKVKKEDKDYQVMSCFGEISKIL